MNLNGHIIRQWRRLIRLNLEWRFWMRLRSWLGWEMQGMMGRKCKNKNKWKRGSSNKRWSRYKRRINKLMTSNIRKRNNCNRWNNCNLTSSDNSRLKIRNISYPQMSKSPLKKNQNGRRWLRTTTLLKMYHKNTIHRIRPLLQIMLRSRCFRIFSFWMVVFLKIGKMVTKIMMVVWQILFRSNSREMGWFRRLRGKMMRR